MELSSESRPGMGALWSHDHVGVPTPQSHGARRARPWPHAHSMMSIAECPAPPPTTALCG